MAEGDLSGLRGARKVYLRTITNTEKEILDLTRDFVDPHNEIIYRDNKIMFTIVKLDCNLLKFQQLFHLVLSQFLLQNPLLQI